MKSIIKERMIEIIHSMEDAHAYLKSSTNEDMILTVCATCQQTAMQLGTILEEKEPNCENIVPCLEEYCEQIFQYLSLLPEERDIGVLETTLQVISKKIMEDIQEEKVKAVFMPYNASMWDTFNSVYRLMKEDPRFDVKVVPIPYYSLGKNGEMIGDNYEGDAISRFAPVTDYHSYHLANECPDIIFIHNPYDEYNLITRVHSEYYSKNLIKYTRHLVYIPYYISANKTYSHMCQLPGCINAWRIFVQSEEIRQQYINAGIAPEKVVASGSPKCDSIYEAMKDEKILPEEWSKLRGKKIFLYTTHLSDILAAPERFIRQIQQVFEVFKGRDDVGMIWRPHPLNIQTIKTSCRQILPSYMQLIEQSKIIGIYDDTPDLDRSIAIADAYIGEEASSVTQLFELTGKPVYYLRKNVANDTLQERYIHANAVEMIDHRAYAFSSDLNLIAIIDLESGDISLEKGYPNYSLSLNTSTNFAVYKSGYIYYMPTDASKAILKYNIATHEKEILSLDSYGISNAAFRPVLYREYIYLFPEYYSEWILVLDTRNDTFKKISTKYKQQIANSEQITTPLVVGAALAGDSVWRVCRFGAYIQEFNLITHQTTYYQLNDTTVFYDLTFDGRYLWLASLYGCKIVKWDPKTKKAVDTIVLNQWNSDHMEIVNIQYHNNEIWLLFRNDPAVVRIHTKTKKVEVINCHHIIDQRSLEVSV